MNHTLEIPCPNCGLPAVRRYFSISELQYSYFPEQQVTQTECFHCDYLMVVCSANGSVIEGYAPGISSDGHGDVGHQIRDLAPQPST